MGTKQRYNRGRRTYPRNSIKGAEYIEWHAVVPLVAGHTSPAVGLIWSSETKIQAFIDRMLGLTGNDFYTNHTAVVDLKDKTRYSINAGEAIDLLKQEHKHVQFARIETGPVAYFWSYRSTAPAVRQVSRYHEAAIIFSSVDGFDSSKDILASTATPHIAALSKDIGTIITSRLTNGPPRMF